MEDNVIYINGNTYEHREKLNEISFFDWSLRCYVAPISKTEDVNELVTKYHLQTTQAYQKDFIEPSNEKEREIRKTESKINSSRYKLKELESEISGNQDIESKEIKDKQIPINSLEELIASLEDKKKRLEEDYKRGQTNPLRFQSLAEIQKETGQDWFSVEPPPQPMLLKRQDGKDFLPKGIVSLLCAAGGTGKTRLCAQLAFCISAGIPFLGEFENTKEGSGRVFLGLGEEPQDGIRRRLYHVAQHYEHNREIGKIDFNEVANNLVPYSFYGQNTALIDDKGMPTERYFKLLEELKRTERDGYDLIIIDPLSRFLGSVSEKDNDNATKYISLMERITQEIKGNPTVLMAHHTKKSSNWRSQEASRGASAIPAGVRWQLNMVGEYEAQGSKEESPEKKKHLQQFVRADLVKRNDVPPLEDDIALKFNKNGVLVLTADQEINYKEDQTNSSVYEKFS